jgi:hypothetical protein
MPAAKEVTEIFKNSLDAAKSIVILIVVLVLLFGHDYVQSVLDRFNVTKINVGGLVIDRERAVQAIATASDELPKAQSQLAAANDELSALRVKYADAVSTLEKLKHEVDKSGRAALDRPAGVMSGQREAAIVSGPAPALTGAAIRAAEPALEDAARAAANVEAAARSTQQVVANLPKAGESAFAVVFGGDASEAAAAAEIARARAQGLPAEIFLRQRSYRSVAPFAGRAEAQAALPAIRALGRTAREAYVVNLASWCPEPKAVSATVKDCGF